MNYPTKTRCPRCGLLAPVVPIEPVPTAVRRRRSWNPPRRHTVGLELGEHGRCLAAGQRLDDSEDI